MNIKTLHKIILEVWFVGRQAMEKTCISLCVKIRAISYTRVYGKKKPRPQAVWSSGIPQQAVRWHSLHVRSSQFFLSNLCGERTKSAALAGSYFTDTALQAEHGPAATLAGHKQVKGGGTVEGRRGICN